MTRASARPFILYMTAVASAGLTACSSDSDTTGSGSNDSEAPRVAVSEPATGSVVDSDSVTVRGTAIDLSTIVSVRVNGIEASSQEENFARWSAAVPLLSGENVLNVRAEDEHGNVDENAATVRVTRRAGDNPNCGDGSCGDDEDCQSCPADCGCGAGMSCDAGTCVEDPGCGDGSCGNGESCSSCPADCGCGMGMSCDSGVCVEDPSCGDGSCGDDENCSTCPADCGCEGGMSCREGVCGEDPGCGDGSCGEGEDCGSCPADCACAEGSSCEVDRCVVDEDDCGNDRCDPDENCASCAADCACGEGMLCMEGTCEPEAGCDNGRLDEGEVCDGELLGDASCETLGFAGGTLSCRDGCAGLDDSACTLPELSVSTPRRIHEGEIRNLLVSPDGRWLALIDPYDSRLQRGTLHLYATDGSTHRVLSDVASAFSKNFTPDSSTFYYIHDYRNHSPSPARHELRLVPLSGGAEIPLQEQAGFFGPRLQRSPDGRYLVYSVGSQRDLYVAETCCGRARQIGTDAGAMRISRDNRWVVFTTGHNRDTNSATLHIAPLAGGESRRLASGVFSVSSGNIACVRISDDGESVVFVDSVQDLGAIRRGRLKRIPSAGGSESLIDDDIRFEGTNCLGVSQNNDHLIYWKFFNSETHAGSAHLVPFTGGTATRLGNSVGFLHSFTQPRFFFLEDFVKGQFIEEPLTFVPDQGRLMLHTIGNAAPRFIAADVDWGPGYSPDRTHAYFYKNLDLTNERADLTLVRLENGETQEPIIAASRLHNRWSSDSRWLSLMTHWNPEAGTGRLFAIDTSSGAGPVELRDGVHSTRFAGPGGRMLYVHDYDAEADLGTLSTMRADGTGGREIARNVHLGGSHAHNPDRSLLVFTAARAEEFTISGGVLRVMDTATGATTEVESFASSSARWLGETNSFVYYVPSGERAGLWTATVQR